MHISQLTKLQGKFDPKKPLRFINHNQDPVTGNSETVQGLAGEYIRAVSRSYGIETDALENMSLRTANAFTSEKNGFRFETEKRFHDTSVISYVQTYMGIPVYGSGIKTVMAHNPLRITSSASTLQFGVDPEKPSADTIKNAQRYAAADLLRALGLKAQKDNPLVINGRRTVIYRLDSEHRSPAHDHSNDTPVNATRSKKATAFQHFDPTLKLPPLDKRLKNGNYYFAHEVLFTFRSGNLKTMNWIAFIELETNSVLFHRALVDNVNAYVFKKDPFDSTGAAGNSNTANNATLNPLRDTVVLQGLVPDVAGVQSLTGEYVTIVDDEVFTVAPPTTTTPFEFYYDVRTNDFAAANAYYHCDGFFRMFADMGFNVASYFDGTVFPVHIDHRGRFGTIDGIEINASCNGDAGSDGIGLVDFELATLDDNAANPVGMALVSRVVMHELGGHGILWDHVNSPNFGFAHSAGDSVGVILNDPGSLWGDRFDSFPWVILNVRRHDRDVTAGWAWGGSNDFGGYSSEQILSTTLFRFYRSIGGDHPALARKQFASRFALYLIFKAVGTLTPATNPANAEAFEIALEDADAADWTSVNPAETYAGGAYHKVIRWAFEKQGMFQPPGAPSPVVSEGAAPDVDVYINDGRNGEYEFLYNHWSCTDIWNRTDLMGGDGGGVHQEPIVGQINHAYVRISNRGSLTAKNIVVKGFHCLPGVGLTYPDDWAPMTTIQLSAPDLAPGATEIVGPFEWTPSQIGHECMFMSVSADDGVVLKTDASNIDGRVTGPIPEWRLVPNDNNIGQRNVAPVAGGGGLTGLIASLEGRTFWVNNSFDRDNVKIEIKVTLPEFLKRKNWNITFSNPGADKFTLHKGMKKEVRMHVIPGADFTADEVLKNEADSQVIVEVSGDGILMGGMNYYLDASLKRTRYTYDGREQQSPGKSTDITKTLTDMLNIKPVDVKCIKLSKITVDIHLKNGDCDC
jgi:hypothetical protein